MAEDFTSLLGTVSAWRSAPPHMAVFEPAPFEIGCKQCHERLDVTRNRGVKSVLDLLAIVRAHRFCPPVRAAPLLGQ